MKYPFLFLMFAAFCFSISLSAHAETASTAHPTLEEMSTAELKDALRKSHAEIESRLGASALSKDEIQDERLERELYPASSEKASYERSVRSQIDALDYKIEKLEHDPNRDRSSAQSSVYRLKDLKSKAREQLALIKSDTTENWKTRRKNLDNILRSAAAY